ncbi:MAG: dipicolinate synthase subunit DpsA [Clostridia bacterium]|nr:dipicolinate synthase subunit DpsA [Clostridia bacterium]
MRTIETFAVIGGDLRSAYLAGALAADGYRVITAGFDGTELPACVTACTNAAQAIALADCVILPLPVSTDGVNVNAPFSRVSIPLETVVQAVREDQLLFGGQISDAFRRELSLRGLTAADYFCREELAVLNAVPTAEGAIQLAMEELPITLAGSRCLITGYGRIGRVLARLLTALDASVTVAARRCSDRAWAQAQGCRSVEIDAVSRERYDVIFNTVPYKLFTREVLEGLDKSTLLIDLASRPGGVDFNAAAELRLKTIWALSLPGRVAPQSAGVIIKKTVLNMIKEEPEWNSK